MWESVPCNTSNGKELDQLYKKLKKIAPHINWEIHGHDHELGSYSDLMVPYSQYHEAEYIIERFEDGDDLSNYSYKDKFPNVYINSDEGKIINPSIIKFKDLAKEYISLIDNFYNMDLCLFIEKLLKLLPPFYLAGQELNYDLCDINLPENGYQYKKLNFGKYDIFYDMEDIYDKSSVNEYSVGDVIDTIMLNIDTGVLSFKKSNTEKVATIAYDWHIAFNMEDGIGINIIRLLKSLRGIIINMEKEKREEAKKLRLKKSVCNHL